jgi:membrane protease YdiL (CAAX protease family)
VDVDPRRFAPLAWAVSSLAFGLLHGAAWLAGSAAGLVYALAQRARGRTADAVVAHGLTNLLIALDVLVRGNYGLWV